MEWTTNNTWDVYIPTQEEIMFNNLHFQLEMAIENGWVEEVKEIRKQLLNYVF
jgi:hypothetical protein